MLIFPDASKPTATVNITYLVGSRHEGYGETGMAHLLEHMNFKGTPTHPNIPPELTRRGARVNGTTWFDRTNYFETSPPPTRTSTWALELEADRMVHSNIAKKDLETEMTVVRNEYEMGENIPAKVLFERMLSTAYLWHNYGKRRSARAATSRTCRSSGCRRSTTSTISRTTRCSSSPARSTRRIRQAGRGSSDRFRSRCVRSTAGNMIYPTYTEEPTQDGERENPLRRTGDVQVAMARYHVPAGSHPDFAAVDVLTEVLGNAPGGRLYKALVEPKLAASTFSFAFQLREPSILLGAAQLRAGQSADTVVAAMERTFDRAASTPFTDEEVKRAKTARLRDMETRVEQLPRDRLRSHGVGGNGRLAAVLPAIATASPRSPRPTCSAWPRRISSRSNRDARALHSDGHAQPRDDSGRRERRGDGLGLQRGHEIVQAGEAFDASPANIDARTRRSTLAERHARDVAPQTNARWTSASHKSRCDIGTEQSLTGRGRRLESAHEHALARHDDADAPTSSTTRSTGSRPRFSSEAGRTRPSPILETTKGQSRAGAQRSSRRNSSIRASTPNELDKLKQRDAAPISRRMHRSRRPSRGSRSSRNSIRIPRGVRCTRRLSANRSRESPR